MKRSNYSSLLKYCSPKVIYVVNRDKRLEKKICPFPVKALKPIGEIQLNEVVNVDYIKITPNLITVFIINSKAYYFYHFEIL